MKLRDMTQDELEEYAAKWGNLQQRYQQGSKNWQKCQQRIKKAKKILGGE